MNSQDPQDPRHDDALGKRLHSAFSSVRAGDDLHRRIRLALDEARGSTPDEPPAGPERPIPFPNRSRLVVPLGAAAAIALLIAGLWMVHTPGVAHASPIEAIEWMHMKDLEPCRRFKPVEDPDRLEFYLRNKLGFEAIVPPPPPGGEYVGGCVRALWNRPAASYLVRLSGKSASVVIFSRRPETLRFPRTIQRDGATMHLANHGQNNLVCVRVGKVTYAAVGAAETDDLIALLEAVREESADSE